MAFRFEGRDEVDKFFIFYMLFYLVVFVITCFAWIGGDYEEPTTPEGHEVIPRQPEAGPFR